MRQTARPSLAVPAVPSRCPFNNATRSAFVRGESLHVRPSGSRLMAMPCSSLCVLAQAGRLDLLRSFPIPHGGPLQRAQGDVACYACVAAFA